MLGAASHALPEMRSRGISYPEKNEKESTVLTGEDSTSALTLFTHFLSILITFENDYTKYQSFHSNTLLAR